MGKELRDDGFGSFGFVESVLKETDAVEERDIDNAETLLKDLIEEKKKNITIKDTVKKGY